MNSLGDAFPLEWRENLANDNLKLGAVIRIHVPDTTPPKIKILIVVGIESEKALLATIFVNTDVNPNIFNTLELRSLQYELAPIHCPYLDHTSYADCSKLRERSFKDILDLIKEQPTTHLGQLPQSELINIRALIKSAKTVSVRLKKQYGLFM